MGKKTVMHGKTRRYPKGHRRILYASTLPVENKRRLIKEFGVLPFSLSVALFVLSNLVFCFSLKIGFNLFPVSLISAVYTDRGLNNSLGAPVGHDQTPEAPFAPCRPLENITPANIAREMVFPPEAHDTDCSY